MTTLQPTVLYCRVSDPKQKHAGHGLESQEHRCRQFAQAKGLDVERVFLDDVTGGGDFNKRPAMTQLIDYLKKNKTKNYVVVFDDIKRFSRDVYFYWGLIRQLDEFKAQPMSPNFVFEKTPEGRFQQSITVAAGEYERESNARQTQQKTKARLEAGYHAFTAPSGYRFEKDKLRGRVLVKDEPVASIVTEVLNGFAAGRFQTLQEVKRYLDAHPDFPKCKSGVVGNSRVRTIFSNVLYAGMIEYEPWGVSLRQGVHEGMITYKQFKVIQEKLAGRSYAATRKDLHLDFPLRGAVACQCGNSLTANWSKSGTGVRHAYYICRNRKCEYRGKSIRRDVIEGAFEELLKSLKPAEKLIRTAEKMLRKLWDGRELSVEAQRQSLNNQIEKIDQTIENLLDRIVDAKSSKVVAAFERRIEKHEEEKLLIEEQLGDFSAPKRSFDEMYRTALTFLSNPHKIWALGDYDVKRAVLKLTFTDRLVWDRTGVYRTADLSLPFRVLQGVNTVKNKMVPTAGIELATY